MQACWTTKHQYQYSMSGCGDKAKNLLTLTILLWLHTYTAIRSTYVWLHATHHNILMYTYVDKMEPFQTTSDHFYTSLMMTGPACIHSDSCMYQFHRGNTCSQLRCPLPGDHRLGHRIPVGRCQWNSWLYTSQNTYDYYNCITVLLPSNYFTIKNGYCRRILSGI